jgi:hypothetical protein
MSEMVLKVIAFLLVLIDLIYEIMWWSPTWIIVGRILVLVILGVIIVTGLRQQRARPPAA